MSAPSACAVFTANGGKHASSATMIDRRFILRSLPTAYGSAVRAAYIRACSGYALETLNLVCSWKIESFPQVAAAVHSGNRIIPECCRYTSARIAEFTLGEHTDSIINLAGLAGTNQYRGNTTSRNTQASAICENFCPRCCTSVLSWRTFSILCGVSCSALRN